MRAINYLLTAAVGLALGGCAVPNDAGQISQAPATEESRLKLNTFEVFFDVDHADLSEMAAKTLRDAADSVRKDKVGSVSISVHTDTVGGNASERDLAERRNQAVRAELVKDGVPADKIVNVGAGNVDGLVPVADGVHEPQNRRTEIILR